MARKLLFAGLAVVILGSSVALFPSLALQRALAAAPAVGAATGQQMLAATVQIVLFAPVLDDRGEPIIFESGGEKQMEFRVAEGLGTAVRLNGEVLIVTHDHWSLLAANIEAQLARARFFDADGEQLLELSGQDFLKLIRYRDGGTMLLAVPPGLAPAVRPVETGDGQGLDRGDVAFIVYRPPAGNGLGVETMVVTSTEEYEGRTSLELRSAEGRTVISGNSGGGVWHDGRLVGNMWTTAMFQNRRNGAMRSSDISRAARVPLGL